MFVYTDARFANVLVPALFAVVRFPALQTGQHVMLGFDRRHFLDQLFRCESSYSVKPFKNFTATMDHKLNTKQTLLGRPCSFFIVLTPFLGL